MQLSRAASVSRFSNANKSPYVKLTQLKSTLLKSTLFTACLLSTTLAQAADVPEGSPSKPTPSVSRWADRCTDFTSNGWAFKSPRNFLPWLEVFSDPAIWLEFARRGLDPQSYVRSLSSLLDPATPKNYLEWGDPAIYEQWAKAAVEPDFYTAVNAIVFDPGRYLRWAALPLDPRAWNLLGTALSPETWGKWLAAPVHRDTQALIAKALDPETALKWSEALANPQNYPALKGIKVATPTTGQPALQKF